ncbi:MAG: hypothetical protein F6K42_35030 [Leptolyngbya sp. SIO1D8]|nr:hypothetical protein [Leptolyngbya sp. SIO1D8]
MFDVFVAQLRCPCCSMVLAEAEIQTHIRDGSADGSSLGIGFEFDPADLEAESILDADYTLVRHPDANKQIQLLDTWICPQCETEQWAMVKISDQRIFSIEAVKLDRKTLESANFISEVNADLLAELLTGEEPIIGENSVEILRRKLP